MQRPKLTNRAVERFICPDGKKQAILWCGETKGFGMKLSSKTGTRTYMMVYRVKGAGKERFVTIGRHGDMSVDQARTKAIEIKLKMIAGIDPVEENQKKRSAKQRQVALDAAQSTTLKEVLESYLNKGTKHGPLRAATQRDMRRHCEKNLTAWLDQPVATINRDKCLRKFTELSERSPHQANSCLVYLRALLNHARDIHATEDGEYPVLAVNPVSRMFKIKKPNPEKPSNTRIPLEKVGACWNWLQARRVEARTVYDRCAADWLCFVLLTGTRRLESGSLRWDDINFDSKTFTLRGEVVKNHTTLTLPMSQALYELLLARRNPPPSDENVVRRRRVQRSSEYVFASNGRKSPFITNAQATVEALSKVADAHVHLHALRRTFDDIAQECKVDSDQRRLLLNHINGDVHARHYANNTKTLASAVQVIAQWIIEQGKIAAGENVIQLFSSKVIAKH